MAQQRSSVRVDKWLWSVRAYKTRSAANDACSSGRIVVNDEPAKPATKLVVGDRVRARRKDRTIDYEVVQLLEKRVGAVLAAAAYVDHSPPVPDLRDPAAPVYAKRDRGSGRPTKRDRRKIEKFKTRD